MHVAVKSRDLTLDDMLMKFWQIEEFSQTKNRYRGDDRAESHFVETTKICPTGRLMVRLPLKPTTDLGQSYDMARQRFLSLERRFQRD